MSTLLMVCYCCTTVDPKLQVFLSWMLVQLALASSDCIVLIAQISLRKHRLPCRPSMQKRRLCS